MIDAEHLESNKEHTKDTHDQKNINKYLFADKNSYKKHTI